MAGKPFGKPFKPGQGGRKPGARNRLTDAFIKDFLADYEKHGKEIFPLLRAEKFDVYAKLIHGLVPREDLPDINIGVKVITTGVVRAGDDPITGATRPYSELFQGGSQALPAPESKPFSETIAERVPFLTPGDPAPIIEVRPTLPPSKKETDFARPLEYREMKNA